jgi:CheY-like chemotaxis protein/anti-sigma regulatory factor (Ser/Thr protein kinase)
MAETVLIADGKGSRRRRLKTLLTALGYRVLAAGSGAAALDLAETARLRVVLMAACLPDMPAESLLRAIRERSRDATRLILCEGPGEVSRLKHAADGVLLPPLHADSLEVVLRGACEREALRRRLRQQPVRIERRLEKRFRQRLETERLLVVKQIVDKISTFIGRIARDVEGGVRYFNEMPYFVSIHDRQARVLAASRPYRMLLGAHAGDGSGSIYEGESGESGGCPVGRTLATANAQQSREVVRYRSGAKVPVIVHTAPIYNDNGEVELVLEVSAGTQDVKRLRDDTHNTQQRYQLLFDAVPCYLAVLDRGLAFSANNRAFITEFGNRTGTAFRDVFCLDDEAFLTVDIQAFADDLVETVQPKFDGKGIRLECDIKGLPASFEVDADMLRSAVVNVLENAVDACVAQGLYREPRAVLRIEAGGDTVEITVTDNGIGMSAEQLQNLFTIFFSTKGSQGTGLGLFLTDRIIRQHGGQIAVESRPGHGSRFRMTLPRRAEGQAQKA